MRLYLTLSGSMSGISYSHLLLRQRAYGDIQQQKGRADITKAPRDISTPVTPDILPVLELHPAVKGHDSWPLRSVCTTVSIHKSNFSLAIRGHWGT